MIEIQTTTPRFLLKGKCWSIKHNGGSLLKEMASSLLALQCIGKGSLSGIRNSPSQQEWIDHGYKIAPCMLTFKRAYISPKLMHMPNPCQSNDLDGMYP